MSSPELWIDPDLLVYIWKFELSNRYQSSRPEQEVVHDWVMSPRIQVIESEDTEGIKKFKKLNYNLGGENDVR